MIVITDSSASSSFSSPFAPFVTWIRFADFKDFDKLANQTSAVWQETVSPEG